MQQKDAELGFDTKNALNVLLHPAVLSSLFGAGALPLVRYLIDNKDVSLSDVLVGALLGLGAHLTSQLGGKVSAKEPQEQVVPWMYAMPMFPNYMLPHMLPQHIRPVPPGTFFPLEDET